MVAATSQSLSSSIWRLWGPIELNLHCPTRGSASKEMKKRDKNESLFLYVYIRQSFVNMMWYPPIWATSTTSINSINKQLPRAFGWWWNSYLAPARRHENIAAQPRPYSLTLVLCGDNLNGTWPRRHRDITETWHDRTRAETRPGHHRDLTVTSPRHDRDITETSPRRDRDITGTRPGHHADRTETSPGHHRDTTETSPGHRRHTIETRHHRDITETRPRHHRDITETWLRHDQDITETWPRRHRDVTDTSPRHDRDMTETRPRQDRDILRENFSGACAAPGRLIHVRPQAYRYWGNSLL